jgi:hypothetical protein
LLCLIIKALNCFVDQLESILGVMSGLTLDLSNAISSGNTELQRTLECAQENAAIAADHLTKSVEPIGVILKMAGPLMGLAGVPAIELPALGSETDVESLEETIKTMKQVIGTLQIAVDAIGGCG